MIGIETKLLSPTQKLGWRCRAKLTDNSTYTIFQIEDGNAFTLVKSHISVAKKLAMRMGWVGVWVSAYMPTGFIFTHLRMHDGHLPVIYPEDVVSVVGGES